MIYTLMNKNNPVIDFETQMGTILRITDTWNEEYLPIGTRTKTGIDVKTLNHWWHGRSIPASRTGIKEALENMGIDSSKELLEKSYGLSILDPTRSLKDTMERYQFFCESVFRRCRKRFVWRTI